MTYKLEGIAQSRKVIQSNSGLSIELWKEGSLFGFYFKEVMVNLFQGNYLTGGWTNVYLTKKGQNQSAIPFIGREHVYAYQTNGVLYARKDKDFYSVLRVSLDKDLPIIYFDISIEALQEVVLSPCLFLDLGLAPKGHVASNELYNSHYIDHTVLQHPQYGQVICSRQTQNVGGHPWAMIASSGKGVRYCTDGLAFWGNRVREGQKDPEFLINSNQSHLIQGELSSVALESQEIELKAGQTQQVRFVVFLEENHIEPSSSEDIQKLDQVNWAKEGACFQFNSVQADMSGQSFSYIGERDLQTDSLSAQEVEQKWPSREYEERGEKGELLSFFSGTCRHIVMKEKELIQERATGTVLFSGKKLALEPECLSVTNYMNGSFASQLAIGNTSFNRITAVNKQPLFLSPMSGQWICVFYENQWQKLKTPSAFEMSAYGCVWTYKIGVTEIEVRTHTGLDEHYYSLEVEVKSGESLKFRVFSEYLMGSEEGNAQFTYQFIPEEKVWKVMPSETSMWGQKHPNVEVVFKVLTDKKVNIQDDRLLFHDYQRRGLPIIGVDIDMTQEFSIQCHVHQNRDVKETHHFLDYKEALQVSENWLKNTFKLGKEGSTDRIMKAIPWFIHNMIVHMKVPRGLEQFSGAAWGVRDVSQGPVEGLLCLRRYEDVKMILERLFSHQRSSDGNWPQWFMFDEYKEIQAGESHGDVILWPVKAVATYIQESNDQNFWNQTLGYDGEGKNPETVLQHCIKAFQFVKNHSVGETHLPAYLDGDWNDSLQPLSHEERDNMVSAWTTGLLYQVLSQVLEVLPENQFQAEYQFLTEYQERVKKDFQEILIQDKQVCGFAILRGGQWERLVHPQDKETGLKYRLLPMNRGIISGLFDAKEAQYHYDLIQKNLLYKDGARLLEKPIFYQGGKSVLFKRAEQSAYFGREISLQYMHAHIRYIEALCRLGQSESLQEALDAVSPIDLPSVISYASIRQSNMYFSSSDANFKTRKEAQETYEKLKEGRIQVKGGWRLYSSGPGIFINQLVSNVLGIRFDQDKIIIDPVIPSKWADENWVIPITLSKNVVLSLQNRLEGAVLQSVVLNQVELQGQRLENPYRCGGLSFDRQSVENALTDKVNKLELKFSDKS